MTGNDAGRTLLVKVGNYYVTPQRGLTLKPTGALRWWPNNRDEARRCARSTAGARIVARYFKAKRQG